MKNFLDRKTQQAAKQLGEYLRTRRKLLNLTTYQISERASINRDTLRKIELGENGDTENLLKVFSALGMLEEILAVSDPYNTDLGRARADRLLPERVRL